MAPQKNSKAMPSMKDLQNLLETLEAEGGLAIGGGDGPANLDELYEDSYIYSVLHNKIMEDTVLVAHMSDELENDQDTESTPTPETTATESSTSSSSDNSDTSEKVSFKVLTLPKECYWGDDHESLGNQLLVRPGFDAVLSALLAAPSSSGAMYMAAGKRGIGKSCLAYYLFYKLFQAGHNVIISDPMFTNAFLNKTYHSCYSPHLEQHPALHEAITAASSSSSSPSSSPVTWWICDDGYLPIQGASCNMFVNATIPPSSSENKAEKEMEKLRKRGLPTPIQFQISKWTMDEAVAGALVALDMVPASPSSSQDPFTTPQKNLFAETYKKFKGNPRKMYGYLKPLWAASQDQQQQQQAKSTKASSKT
ncbi:hypothetical protein BGW38_001579, partial [Lunasporangiospora selenospora]